jgi:mono/diheme cytochrome c family protein
MESKVRRIGTYIVLAGVLVTSAASGADAENGKRVALSRCATCHIVEPSQRDEIADSPPFETIARKVGFDTLQLTYMIRNPHPRMNLTLSQREAQDIAAYMSSLMR